MAKRNKVFHPAALLREGGPERLHLLNVTAIGALGYTYTPPKKGEVCRLLLFDQQVDAEIIWQEDRKFGLSFTTPISADLVQRLIAAS